MRNKEQYALPSFHRKNQEYQVLEIFTVASMKHILILQLVYTPEMGIERVISVQTTCSGRYIIRQGLDNVNTIWKS